VRRVYVRPAFRRQGVARTLASALIQEGLDQVDLLTVNAAASPAAAPFWEAQGFAPDATGPWTHVLRRSAG
jgi:GNAT superfamily N-acetyltransferase